MNDYMKDVLNLIKSDYSIVYNPIDKVEVVINNDEPIVIPILGLYSFINKIFPGASINFLMWYTTVILLELAQKKDYLDHVGLNPYNFEDYNLDDNPECIITGVNSLYIFLDPSPFVDVKIEWVLNSYEQYH